MGESPQPPLQLDVPLPTARQLRSLAAIGFFLAASGERLDRGVFLCRPLGMPPGGKPMSTLDAELNDFGAQLAMLGGHAADRDG